jgi:hypothetical protein
MNDPGVDGPINDAANDVENNNPYEKQQEEEEKDEDDFLDPRYVYWQSTPASRADLPQPMVVRLDSIPVDCGYLWSYGQRVQYLRPGREMESIHAARQRRSPWCRHTRSLLVRNTCSFLYA